MGDSTSSTAYSRLLQTLSGPSPSTCQVTRIDFVQIGLPEYKDFFAIIIDDALSPEECRALVTGAETANNQVWDQALVNTGNGNQALYTDIRLCDRIIWDDETVAAKIMDRINPHLPEDIVALQNCGRVTGHGPVKRKETWRISRLNERMRFLRYSKGMYFRPHCDGSYVTPDKKEITFLTAHLYLNSGGGPTNTKHDGGVGEEPLQGGATRFVDSSGVRGWDVSPKAGSVLVFQQRNLLHSGEDVLQGTKYTLRSDILYKMVEQA